MSRLDIHYNEDSGYVEFTTAIKTEGRFSVKSWVPPSSTRIRVQFEQPVASRLKLEMPREVAQSLRDALTNALEPKGRFGREQDKD